MELDPAKLMNLCLTNSSSKYINFFHIFFLISRSAITYNLFPNLFYRYNSGGKCFSQIHTKHLTVTIDAFTIHNSLWQGKKVNLPSKKDMALVI